MNKFFLKHKNQKGYAILFTIVIVSAVSVITAGLTSTIYKQLILSSLAKDSQTAFYQSDTATDCSLYADRIVAVETPPDNVVLKGGTWSCGNSNLIVTPIPNSNGGYTILPEDENSGDPCFRIYVSKNPVVDADGNSTMATKIQAKGYNFCDLANSRTVEREIEINYIDQ